MGMKQEYPLVSFCIVAYKAEAFIAEAINGAFAQDYPNMEIIMSDDCSPDRTYEIMQEMAASYKGPHAIILNRNQTNLGPRENYNKALYELAHGEILVIADGDDISVPERTRKCVDVMLAHPTISSLSCVSRKIYADGSLSDVNPIDTISDGHVSIYTLWDYLNSGMMMNSGDSRVLRRSVIDSFPPLKWSFSEDVFLFVRSFYVGDVALIHEPLVKYRQHDGSIMGKARQRKKVSKEKLQQFEQTSAKQLREDLIYAIEHNYIKTPYVEIVSQKIEDVICWLRPQQKTLSHRVIRKFNKIISRWCNNLDTKLP